MRDSLPYLAKPTIADPSKLTLVMGDYNTMLMEIWNSNFKYDNIQNNIVFMVRYNYEAPVMRFFVSVLALVVTIMASLDL